MPWDEAWLSDYQARRTQPVRPVEAAPSAKKVMPSVDEILTDYQTTKNIWRTAENLGICHSSVARRLRPILGDRLSAPKGWSDTDEALLRLEYDDAAEAGKLESLAAKMGRTVEALYIRASRLGLGKRGRPQTCDLAHLSEVRKEWHKNNPHPRGMLGKKHTPETIVKTTAATKAAWANPKSKFNSPKYRQGLSDRLSALSAAGKVRVGYSRGSAGRAPDLGDQYYRSSWERNYARYLNFLLDRGDIAKWEYEADTFWFHKILRGVRSYKPDFKVWARTDAEPYYVEVKGWMDDKSKTKLKRMKKYYPKVRIDLVDQKQFRALAQTIGPILPRWETLAGSQFRGARDLLI